MAVEEALRAAPRAQDRDGPSMNALTSMPLALTDASGPAAAAARARVRVICRRSS
ncbi:MAG: hypothetical protein IT514_13770 [Burkholderiales bacterium]|nr:hypothetical protein [Burkholderiales bacterium]